MHVGGGLQYLGAYDTAEDAAQAYAEKYVRIHGSEKPRQVSTHGTDLSAESNGAGSSGIDGHCGEEHGMVCIKDRRIRQGKWEYKVLWEPCAANSYVSDEETWEVQEDLVQCSEALRAFLEPLYLGRKISKYFRQYGFFTGVVIALDGDARLFTVNRSGSCHHAALIVQGGV